MDDLVYKIRWCLDPVPHMVLMRTLSCAPQFILPTHDMNVYSRHASHWARCHASLFLCLFFCAFGAQCPSQYTATAFYSIVMGAVWNRLAQLVGGIAWRSLWVVHRHRSECEALLVAGGYLQGRL